MNTQRTLVARKATIVAVSDYLIEEEADIKENGNKGLWLSYILAVGALLLRISQSNYLAHPLDLLKVLLRFRRSLSRGPRQEL
ncbi:MAG: hypothetical protein ACJA2Q_001821 [Pseudohongiellaceae bacterium]|jgi:hypothetical protein